MPVNSLARTVLRLQYNLIRSPLTALDAQVLGRLPDSSRVRITFTRRLADLDTVAGRVLHDERLIRRGDIVTARMNLQEQAAESASKADTLRARADEVKSSSSAQADQRRSEAARVERDRIAAALREEQETSQHVGELADADAAERKRQVEMRAKHQQAELAAQRQAKERRISAAKNEATVPAKAQLESAAQTKADARERRVAAEKLDDLVTAEKTGRRDPTS